jgi:hypothetical protein
MFVFTREKGGTCKYIDEVIGKLEAHDTYETLKWISCLVLLWGDGSEGQEVVRITSINLTVDEPTLALGVYIGEEKSASTVTA